MYFCVCKYFLSRHRAWNPFFRYTESCKTFVYSRMFVASSIASTHVPRDLNSACFSAFLEHLQCVSPGTMKTAGQNQWLWQGVLYIVGDTSTSPGAEFGFWGIRYEKKHCTFTVVEHGSFSVLQSSHLFSLFWKPLLTKGKLYCNATLWDQPHSWGCSLTVDSIYAEVLYWVKQTSFFFCLPTKNCLDPSCV